MRLITKILLVLLGLHIGALAEEPLSGITYTTGTDISYYDDAALKTANDYQRKQCKLDIYHPTNRPGFATLIWFHGGGLNSGHRYFPKLKDQGFAIVAVSYRLLPEAKFPDFLEDAAAATAWTMKNISKYGGDPHKIFVSGHSAGGYLTSMIGMDPKWLAKYGQSNKILAGLIPVSGQMTTHFQVKKLLGDTGESLRPLIDENAPLFYVAKDLPPICLIVGDRKVEWPSRVEENELLAVTLKNMGHPSIEFYEMGGLTHSTVPQGAEILIPTFIKKVSQNLDAVAVPAK